MAVASGAAPGTRIRARRPAASATRLGVPAATSAIPSPIQAYLERVHARHAGRRDGSVASYIPALASADPTWFGICIATVDGAVYEVGDTGQAFTIQSISKPFTYALVLEEHGETAVRSRIGVEPTGDAFNSITLESGSGKPLNPMVNAGAIAAAGLVRAGHGQVPLERIVEAFGAFAGRRLDVDNEVQRSEEETGHRNRAIAHLLRAAGVLDDPDSALATYFGQCSIRVTARDLAVMAATLAAGGRNPLTGRPAARPETVRSILSVMATCGMYDAAGEWLYGVGLPAKSGVSGGILAVLPGQLGIAVFSPPLDVRGNSVRGLAVCRDLSADLDLHLVRPGPAGPPAIRTRYDLRVVGSKRVRLESERARLSEVGTRAIVLELQGDLTFLGAEAVSRAVAGPEPALSVAVIDLRRVTSIDPAVVPVLAELVICAAAAGAEIVLSGADAHAETIGRLADELRHRRHGGALIFPELDLALEWCERQLLGTGPEDVSAAQGAIALRDHDLLTRLSEADGERFTRRLTRRTYRAGEMIVRRGDIARELFLVTRGQLSVVLDLPRGGSRRLATLSAGMTFGELAFLEGERRTADVRSDTATECHVLTAAEYVDLGRTDPGLRAALLEGLLRTVGRTARRMTDELALLAG